MAVVRQARRKWRPVVERVQRRAGALREGLLERGAAGPLLQNKALSPWQALAWWK